MLTSRSAMSSKALSEVESEEESVKRLAAASETGLYVLEDAVELAEPFGDGAVESVRRRAQTLFDQGAMPHGDNTMDDMAVGAYQIAQVAVESRGGESLRGDGTSNGKYARTAYRKNMRRLADLVDGVVWDDLDVTEPSNMK